MESMGKRWRCRLCGRTLSKRRRLPRLGPRLVLPRSSSNGARPRIVEGTHGGLPLSRRSDDGRWTVALGVGHPWANSAGWQYLYRVVVAWYLGRALAEDEQVHHLDLDQANDDPRNLQVVAAVDGGAKYNHKYQRVAVVAEWVEAEEEEGGREGSEGSAAGVEGRLVEHETPLEPVPF